MTAKYGAGDIVLINGVKQTITSWPVDDEGFFTSSYKLHDGGDVQDMKNAKDPNVTIELLEKGPVEVESTAGPVPDVAPAPRARKAAAK